MILIAGLGNYPEKYLRTRHNVGFICLDKFALKNSMEFKAENKFKALISAKGFNNEKVILAKPLTFMNLSGEAISAISNFYKINTENIFIIYDDLSIELGKIRLKKEGSDGGHNGIKSIINHLGTKSFPRLKVGIGPQPAFLKSEDFVLQNFPKEQTPLLDKVTDTTVNIIEDYLRINFDELQNKYNGLNIGD